MRIAINTRFLLKGKLEGIGVFTKEVVMRMVRNNPNVDFFFFFDRAYDESFVFAENVTPVVIGPPARHPLLWYLWFEWAIPHQLKKLKIDHFFSPDSYLSVRSDVPQTVVIHDLAFEHFPDAVSPLVKMFYSYYLPRYADKATQIVTVSEFTKQDIIKKYGIKASNITVTHNAVDEKFCPIPLNKQEEIKEELTNGIPYYLYVGALHPRKNIERLLKGFDLFKKETGSDNKLVLVGRKAWGNREMEQVYDAMEYKEDVIFTGRVSDEELVGVYASSLALVYVPYFEGFGMPIIEAQACGVPVITSNKSSMPEVLGDAGVLVDPFNVESISNGFQVLDDDEGLRQELINKGKTNLKRFDWAKTADIIARLIIEKAGV